LGRAAGRCEFSGCNKPLSRSSVTQNELNLAQKARIRSFSERGPRGRQGIAADDLNSADNLMLVCHQCHRDIDSPAGEVGFTVAVLQEMKRRHESRIFTVSGIDATNLAGQRVHPFRADGVSLKKLRSRDGASLSNGRSNAIDAFWEEFLGKHEESMQNDKDGEWSSST